MMRCAPAATNSASRARRGVRGTHHPALAARRQPRLGVLRRSPEHGDLGAHPRLVLGLVASDEDTGHDRHRQRVRVAPDGSTLAASRSRMRVTEAGSEELMLYSSA